MRRVKNKTNKIILEQAICILMVCILFISCADNKMVESQKTAVTDSNWITITPKNYLDFNYSKVIAFATVNPYDYSNLYFSKNIDITKFHDTISKTLNNEQILYLNNILSGRYNKPYLKKNVEQVAADCFYPRHNIIFLNNQNRVVNYISICFECRNAKQSKSYLADNDNMKIFFDSIGLTVFDRPDYHKQHYDSLNKVKKLNQAQWLVLPR